MAKNNKNAAPVAPAAQAAPATESNETQVTNPVDIMEQIRQKNIISDEARVKANEKMLEKKKEKEVAAYIQGTQKIEYFNARVLLLMLKRRKEAAAEKELLDKTLALILMLGGQVGKESAELNNGFKVANCEEAIKKAGFEAKSITPAELDDHISEIMKENRKKFDKIDEEINKGLRELREACDGRWYLDYTTSMELDRMCR